MKLIIVVASYNLEVVGHKQLLNIQVRIVVSTCIMAINPYGGQPIYMNSITLLF